MQETGSNARITPEAVQHWDNAHFVHPWESLGTGPANRPIIDRAEGIYLYDPDGTRYIDGPGGMWCVQIGYGRQDMAEAIAAQTMKAAYYTPWAFTSEPAAIAAVKSKGDDRIRAGDVMILIGLGPIGCGMPETAQLTIALKHLPWGKHVALITDGRFSGGSHGFIVGHITPEAQEGGPRARAARGVLEARQVLVSGHLLDVVGDVVEVLRVDLQLLEGLEARLRLAHVALLLVLLLSLLRASVLAQDARDGALAGLELAEALEAPGAEARGLVALAQDLPLGLGARLVGAGPGRAGAIRQGAAGAVVLAPAAQPLAHDLRLAAELAGGGLHAVLVGVADHVESDVVLQVLIPGLGDP